MALSARKKAFLPGAIFMALIAIFIMRFGALILILTILPLILAFAIDHSSGKSAFKIIAACNLTAALPFIVPIIQFSLKKQYAEVGLLMDDWRAWAFIYCGSAAGWGMIFLGKYVARTITLMHYEYSAKILEKRQELLVKEWGEDVMQK